MNLAYFPGYYKILGSFLMSTQLAIMNDGNPVDVETVNAETLKNIAAQEYANGDEYWLIGTYRYLFESWGEGPEQSQKRIDAALRRLRGERITELYRSWEKKRIKKEKYLEKLLSKPESKRHKYKKRWSFHIHELP
ncbi:MAG: hypothetical protein GY931_18795 [Maribacter sp.]|nr:hypothetical protein [Maribacter sp.]